MSQEDQDPGSAELFEVAAEGRLLRFKVRPNTDDVNILQEVSHSQCYRDARLLLGEGAVVIDVGAHIGSFTVLSALQGARVLALEPIPVNYAILVENLRLNNLQNRVKALNLAVWSSAGERKMRVADDSTGGSGFYYGKETVPEVTVRCVRLDEFMDDEGVETCDLLKLDCEGAEFDILSTMDRATWDRIRAVVLEYHLFAGHSLGRLNEIFVAQGFLVATWPLGSVPGLGYLLAVRPPVTPSSLRLIEVTLAESPLTRVPVIGRFWQVIRQPVHRLVVFYLNQAIAAYNRHQRASYVYLRLLGEQAVQRERRITESMVSMEE